MKKFAERFPLIAAILSSIGITSILENDKEATLSHEEWQKFESKVKTDIEDVKAENTALKSGVAETERQLTAANAKLTAIDSAVKAGLAAAKVTEQLEAAAGITKMTERLAAWGELPGAVSTSAESKGDDDEALSEDLKYAQAQLGAGRLNLKETFNGLRK